MPAIPQAIASKIFTIRTQNINKSRITNEIKMTEPPAFFDIMNLVRKICLAPKSAKKYKFIDFAQNVFRIYRASFNNKILYPNIQQRKILQATTLLFQLHDTKQIEDIPQSWQILGCAIQTNNLDKIEFCLGQCLAEKNFFSPSQQLKLYNTPAKAKIDWKSYWAITDAENNFIKKDERQQTLDFYTKNELFNAEKSMHEAFTTENYTQQNSSLNENSTQDNPANFKSILNLVKQMCLAPQSIQKYNNILFLQELLTSHSPRFADEELYPQENERIILQGLNSLFHTHGATESSTPSTWKFLGYAIQTNDTKSIIDQIQKSHKELIH